MFIYSTNLLHLTMCSLGNVYIGDQYNHRIRKVDVTTGVISTVAGTGSGSYSGDSGKAASSTLNMPSGVALDLSGTFPPVCYYRFFYSSYSYLLGNVYIADKDNHRIRKVTVYTGIITTLAGTGSASYSGDKGQATSASLYYPQGIVLDSTGSTLLLFYFILFITSNYLGNVYIADTYNNRVRKVTVSTGIITTLAGTGSPSYSGDNGLATSASLYYPIGVALDSAGNFLVYLIDNFTSFRNIIQVITTSLISITTVSAR